VVLEYYNPQRQRMILCGPYELAQNKFDKIIGFFLIETFIGRTFHIDTVKTTYVVTSIKE
jgi:hypothetical protein